MKKIIMLSLVLLGSACSTAPKTVTHEQGEKINNLVVISVLGDEVNLRQNSVSSEISGLGRFSKDIPVSSWRMDAEIEFLIRQELVASKHRVVATKISSEDRNQLRAEFEKIGTAWIEKALSIAAKSGADYAVVVGPNSLLQKPGLRAGNTGPVVLNCDPMEKLPKILMMSRVGILNLKKGTLAANSPVTVEALFGGNITCASLQSEAPRKIETEFKASIISSLKSLAKESIQGVGLAKVVK